MPQWDRSGGMSLPGRSTRGKDDGAE